MAIVWLIGLAAFLLSAISPAFRALVGGNQVVRVALPSLVRRELTGAGEAGAGKAGAGRQVSAGLRRNRPSRPSSGES